MKPDMTGEIEDLGQVMLARDGTRDSFMEILSRLDLRPPVIIKPNWSTSVTFTESEILDWTLSALDCEVIVVESYAFYRSPILKNSEGLSDEDLERKLLAQKKDDLRNNDKWFLDISGISDVLEKHDVKYINLSEELWAKRVTDSETIKDAVEKCFEPVRTEVLYSMVPSKLYDLRGGTLLSLAKPKVAHGAIGVTLTIKNLFGMISTPFRGKFHGGNNELLNESIVDINRICHSLFNVRGVIESVFSTSVMGEDLLKSRIYRNLGYIWGSNSTIELDSMVTAQLGLNPEDIGHLSHVARILGQWTQQSVELGRKRVIDFK